MSLSPISIVISAGNREREREREREQLVALLFFLLFSIHCMCIK